MQTKSLLTFAGVVVAAILGARAEEQAAATTLWVPTATVVETNTYTATRIEQIWTTVPPYEWETTFPITWTATETVTQYASIVTNAPHRRHARDFETS
ncbi:hypothetical protein C8Q70DRAFT_966640 [Cubamyces menziesii]|uniref:Uncharacterized protein n=1 Tax=Trametes cubensis TaxID=1111947 RepID=A0AAD7U242_9APHY|nr:hypothetical protein C8Q70DRAFT_966640 [Cubamyces menziesii]KAJ8495930.1 hypothetical protein ONZ51_g1377 [Trametes cubensis]